ncbi:MAG: hypothetical protein AB4352_14635 [Hormoscilla sp.]
MSRGKGKFFPDHGICEFRYYGCDRVRVAICGWWGETGFLRYPLIFIQS